MSHVRPRRERRRDGKPNCRKGLHSYGPTQEIGGGISRRVCEVCHAVSIDLSGAYEMGAPSPTGFFRRAVRSS
ncbi:MAG TPA: hypothetical protein VF246_09790 [Acidimicrobiia bacterium]